MKRTLQTLLSLVVVAASLVSCAKETFKENVIPTGEKIQVAVGGSIGEFAPSDATKANAASVVKVTWEATDVVYVYDGSACLDSLEVTPNEDNPSNALLTGTITASSVSPSNLSLVYVKGATKAPAINDGKISVDIGSQSGTAVTDVPFVLYATIEYDEEKLKKEEEFVPFKFATSVMTVNCTGLPTGEENSKINIIKAEIEGVSTACELTVDGTGVTAVSGASTGTITRTAGFEQSDSRGSFKIALAADPATPAARNILVYQRSKAYGAPFTSKTLAGGKSYNTVYQMSEFIVPPAEMLPGEFTVADPDGIANSGDETKVHFSPGNLYYDGSSSTFKFEDNQLESIPAENGYWDDSHISHFFWSTDADEAIKDEYDSEKLFYDYDVFFTNDPNDATKANAKFTVNVGGENQGGWRTLSSAEWAYLLEYARFAKATVNEKRGLVLLPNTYIHPSEVDTLSEIKNGEADFGCNIYGLTDWAKMESAGAVFLPAAGMRYGTDVNSVGEGNYWSYDAPNDYEAYSKYFTESWVNYDEDFSCNREQGQSVRLVRESVRGYAVKATGVTLNKNKTTINIGFYGEKISYEEKLVATITPVNATNKQIIWLSSDPDIATVNESGTVTSKSEGSAVITATTVDGNFTAACLVTVEPVKVSEVLLNEDNITIMVDYKKQLMANVVPWEAVNKQVIWSSSNETVATVNQNGEVTGIAAGSSVITVTTVDGNFTAECLVTVKPLPPTGTAKRTGDIDVKWIQLWKDGPKFAEYNVGASSEVDYGGYYAWGGSQDKVDDHNTDPYILTGTYDTATNLWGSNWRMPNSVELKGLFENCVITTTNNYNNSGKVGMIITGKGDYEPNSIFLPAAGFCSGGTLSQQNSTWFYWSSTPNNSNSNNAYATYNNSILSNLRSFGFAVRAVLNDAPATTGTAKATIGEVETDVHWVQLWAGGPKFAVYNVGVTSTSPTGTTMTYTDATKAGAEYVWGANWCTPSKDQMDELLKSATSGGSTKVDCNYIQENGVYGFKFTGKETDYTGNSVFFPARDGDSSGGSAKYWSATANGSEVAWYVHLSFGDDDWHSEWDELYQGNECLVRPVLKN